MVKKSGPQTGAMQIVILIRDCHARIELNRTLICFLLFAICIHMQTHDRYCYFIIQSNSSAKVVSISFLYP